MVAKKSRVRGALFITSIEVGDAIFIKKSVLRYKHNYKNIIKMFKLY